MPTRTYDQYCPLARALDDVGERWSLLIVRELLGGPKRYTDLKQGVGAISPTLLATRLEELEAAGVIERQVLPPPAARTVYVLTDEGHALGRAIAELTRWGMHRLPEPDSHQLPNARMAARAALLAYAEPDAVDERDRVYRVDIDGEPFTLTVADGVVRLDDGPPAVRPDLEVTVSATDLIRLRHRTLSAAQATRTGALRYQPRDRARIREFQAAFGLDGSGPAK
ncbi:MAG TPA: helix-turn-helix domain-containing protein [Acidimicrobiales bacterium]|nr:helix-turn-helix domain-containing protein [Acidimicrobiales bacterium]